MGEVGGAHPTEGLAASDVGWVLRTIDDSKVRTCGQNRLQVLLLASVSVRNGSVSQRPNGCAGDFRLFLGVRRPDAAFPDEIRSGARRPRFNVWRFDGTPSASVQSGVRPPHSKGEAEVAGATIRPLRDGAISDGNACDQKDLEPISATRTDLGVVDGGQCPPDIARSEPFCRVGTAHLAHHVSDGRLAGGEETRQPEPESRFQDAGSRPSLQSAASIPSLRNGAVSDGKAGEKKDLGTISVVSRDFGVGRPDEACDLAKQSGVGPPHSKGVKGDVEATSCEAVPAGVGLEEAGGGGPAMGRGRRRDEERSGPTSGKSSRRDGGRKLGASEGFDAAIRGRGRGGELKRTPGISEGLSTFSESGEYPCRGGFLMAEGGDSDVGGG